jgi:hypothetical protein
MISRRWTIRLTSKKPGHPRLSRWRIATLAPGEVTWYTHVDTFREALAYIRKAISRAAIEDLLDRALNVDDPKEYECVRACLILGHDLESKRRTIYDAARHRGLYVSTEVEPEENEADSYIFARIKKNTGIRRTKGATR